MGDLAGHIQRQHARRQEDETRRREAEEQARRQEQESRRRHREARLVELRSQVERLSGRTYPAYPGRGLTTARGIFTTRVKEWVFVPASRGHETTGPMGNPRGGLGSPPRYTYANHTTTTADAITVTRRRLFKPQYEQVVGYYLPEWDISVPIELFDDAIAYHMALGELERLTREG